MKLRGAALAAAAAILALAPAAVAAGPAKLPDPVLLAGSGSGATSFGRTLPGAPRLLVTFEDSPAAAVARSRLEGLGAVAPVLPEAGIWRVIPRGDPVAARRAALHRPRVLSAEWSLESHIDQRPPPPTPLGPTPTFTDPLFTPASQWWLLASHGTWGPDLTTILPRPRIAILDSGVDPTHPEFSGPDSPLVAPRSTIRHNSDASDRSYTGHGTHVAGIAAAPANGIGIVGVAPAVRGQAEIIPVQIADAAGRSTDETMIKGIRWAVRHGAKVINISAGGDGATRAFQDTILWATQRGALVVASVGNEGQDVNSLNFPAAYRRVLGVGAQCDGNVTYDCPTPFGVATFSNHNRSVDVIAPGVDVLSSIPMRVTERMVSPGYGLKDGTSMSAPFVSGLAALVMAANHDSLTPDQVARQIENTATDIGRRGWDPRSGHGVVNPRAAVTLRAPALDPNEVNDDIKWVTRSMRFSATHRRHYIRARVDHIEDPDDVYAVLLRRGQRLHVRLDYTRGLLDLYLWRAGTRTVDTTVGNVRRNLLRFRGGRRHTKIAVFRAPVTGRYFIDVYARGGSSWYRLRMTRGG